MEQALALPVSRRRQALARNEAAEQAFCIADVAALQADPSAAGRAKLARRFGEGFDQIAAGGTRDLARSILELLVRDVESEVRKSLSEAVATAKLLPAETARRLAHDTIEVAAPVLQKSPALSDQELIEIVRTNAVQYALAVAGRERLSDELSDTLVTHGDERVVVRLIGNLGAELSERTLKHIADDYSAHKAVQERLVKRPALPPEFIEQMVAVITDRVAWNLIENQRMAPEQARAMIEGVRERAAISLTAREHGDQQRMRALRELKGRGDLVADDVLVLLREGDIAGFEIGMALHADLDVGHVQRLAYNQDRRFLAALCARAGFSTPHYITLRMALELAEATVSNCQAHRGYSSDSIRFLQRQYERLQNDPKEIDSLVATFKR